VRTALLHEMGAELLPLSDQPRLFRRQRYVAATVRIRHRGWWRGAISNSGSFIVHIAFLSGLPDDHRTFRVRQ